MKRFPLHRRRLAPSITAILTPSVALALALVVLVVSDSARNFSAAKHAEQRTRLLMKASLLAHDLENERDTLARDGGRVTDEVARLRTATDKSAGSFREEARTSAGDSGVTDLLTDATDALDELSTARRGELGTGSVPAVTAYSDIIRPLLDLYVATGGETPGNTRPGALQSLVTGKLAVSEERAVLGAALAEGAQLTTAQEDFLRSRQGIAHVLLGQFRASAEPDDRAAGSSALDTKGIDALVDRALAASTSMPSRQAWAEAADKAIDDLHTVEVAVLNRCLGTAAEENTAAYRSLVIHLAVISTALLATALLTLVTTGRIVRRLKRLQRTALRAAAALPALVQQMSRAENPGRLRLEVPPVDSGARDEIGDVERAFDEVVREAVGQTAKQLALRVAVDDTLATVSRRGNALVKQQLQLLSDWQMHEQDPRILDALYRLDHLATRLRRHGDSVLVLAGEQVGNGHFEDAPLVDVVRAAAGEVERFTQVVVTEVPEVDVVAHAVHDLIHLVAELLENATRSSRPEQPVQVSAMADPRGQVTISVTDRGSGIEPVQLNKLNFFLQATPTIESACGARIGLYVVNRLATRHSIHVRLESDTSGTRALVVLPDSVAKPAGHPRRTEMRP